MNAKQRYDLKRKKSPERKLKEAERAITRILLRRGVLKKLGRCSLCGDKGKTVFHHQEYRGEQSPTVELCYRCHRSVHPRPMPHGGVK